MYIESTHIQNESSQPGDHVLFKSHHYLKLSEQFANLVYFFYVSMATLFLTKMKTNEHFFSSIIEFFSNKLNNSHGSSRRQETVTSTASSHSTSNFVNSINESSSDVNYVDTTIQRAKNKFFKTLFASVFFYVLVAVMLVFTYSVTQFNLTIKCEGFFKNNSKMVCVFQEYYNFFDAYGFLNI